MFYAVVLRPPVAVVGPLLHELSSNLNLNLSQQALLTSIPVFCFGFGAFASTWLTRKIGLDRSLLLLIVVIVIALSFRAWFDFTMLLIGTTAAGLAIAIANVILPSVVRSKFPKKIAPVTSAYTTVLAISASLASSIAVPVSAAFGGWRNSMQLWFYPAVVALFFWWLQQRQGMSVGLTQEKAQHHNWSVVLKHPITWALFAFFGIQSLGFYTMLSWLPSILIDRGFTPANAGGLLGLTTIIGVPFAMVLSSNFGKIKRLDLLGFAISIVTLAGFAVLVLLPNDPLIGCILVGLGMANTFPLSLNWISTRASTAHQTTQLSAISQGFGYLLSGIGTFIFGQLRDVSNSWTLPLLLMVALTAVQAGSAFVAGGRRHIPAAN